MGLRRVDAWGAGNRVRKSREGRPGVGGIWGHRGKGDENVPFDASMVFTVYEL